MPDVRAAELRGTGEQRRDQRQAARSAGSCAVCGMPPVRLQRPVDQPRDEVRADVGEHHRRDDLVRADPRLQERRDERPRGARQALPRTMMQRDRRRTTGMPPTQQPERTPPRARPGRAGPRRRC